MLFVRGLVGCEMAKEVTLSLQWDGLTQSTLYVAHHILLNAPRCLTTWPFVLPVSDCGAFSLTRLELQAESLRQAFSISWSILISMQERTFGAATKLEIFFLHARAYVFVHICQYGPGEQVISHLSIWHAPR